MKHQSPIAASFLVRTKFTRTGYVYKFRICFRQNRNLKIFSYKTCIKWMKHSLNSIHIWQFRTTVYSNIAVSSVFLCAWSVYWNLSTHHRTCISKKIHCSLFLKLNKSRMISFITAWILSRWCCFCVIVCGHLKS